MRFFRKQSLPQKQTTVILFTCGVALLIACITFAAYDVITFRRAMVANVSTIAEIIGDNCAGALDFQDPQSAEEALSALHVQPGIEMGCIYDKAGEVFAVYDRQKPGKTPPPLEQASFYFKNGRLHVFREIRHGDEVIGTVHVESSSTLLYDRLERYVVIIGAVFLLALLVAMFLSARLQKLISGPVLELVQTTRSITEKKDYSMRATVRGDDELSALVNGFNEMLSQIQMRDTELQKAKDVLENRVQERTQELVNSLSLVQSTLEATADGILVIAQNGKVTDFNDQFSRMWRISLDVVQSRDEKRLLEAVLQQLKHPDQFLAKIKELRANPQMESFDVLELIDDRIFEAGARPRQIGSQYAGRVWSFRDVTEQRRAETILRRTEEVYRRAIGGAGAVPYSYDYKTRTYLFMGDGIEALTGYKPHEITPGLWKQIIKESIMLGETAGLEKGEAARKLLHGELKYWRCDMRIITRDGKSRWLSDASVQNTDASGNIIGSIGILQDITERKQAEISAGAFSRMGHQLSTAVSVTQAADIISTVSEELLGWDACWLQLYSEKEDSIYSLINIDTIDGKRVYVAPSEGRKTTELHRRIVKTGAELILRDHANSILPGAISFGNNRPSASLMFVPIRSTTKIVGILSVQSYTPQAYTQQDLRTLQTLADQCGGALERIWADEARKKSETQFRAVWNTSVDGMRLATADGVVQMVNDAYCTLVGKSREELEGASLAVIHAEANKEYILRRHGELFNSNNFKSRLDTQSTLWDGRKLWFEVSNSLLDVPGQPPLLLSIFRDITQRKQAEQELETIHRQLIDASRQAGMAEVATGVLHNVGNVLNSVNVSASLVADDVRQSKANNLTKIAALLKANEHQLEYFFATDPRGKQLIAYLITLADHLTEERKHIIDEMELLRKNIEHIKDIVVMQQNYAKVSGIVETVKITDLVEDALNMNAGALKRHQVRVIRDYGELPSVSVERHKVLQILVNLIRNAKYACDEGNPTDKQLTVRVYNTGDEITISIADNGIGIPPENLTRIFNHGFTTRATGHGFGLHSGALAAKELGGFLTVESEGPGKGATFILHLPCKSQDSNQNN